MNAHIFSATALALAAAALAWNLTHRAPKIAYAETSVILNDFSEAIQARKEFDAAQKGWNDTLKALNDNLGAAMEKGKAVFEKASPAQKDSIQKSLNQMNVSLQTYANTAKQLASEKNLQLMDPVIKKVNGFLDTWGKKHGYDMIFGTMTGGNVLQANADFNVTAAVLKDLNAEYRASASSTSTPPPAPATAPDSPSKDTSAAAKP